MAINAEQHFANSLTETRLLEYGVFGDTEDVKEVAKKYRLRDISLAEATTKGYAYAADGIYIEYPEPRNSRIRYNRTGFQAQQDLGKYGQLPGTKPVVYYPPTLAHKHFEDKEIPLLIVEGEFKAIVVDHIMNGGLQKPTILPIALGGVWSWKSKKLGIEIIPDLAAYVKGRHVYIAFDMDLPINPKVQQALDALVTRIAHLNVKVLIWNGVQGKGLDDFLCARPAPRASGLQLLLDAQVPGHLDRIIELNKQYVYDKTQDAVYDFNTGTYVRPQAFKAHYITEHLTLVIPGKAGKMTSKEQQLGDYWLNSPARATCEGRVFAPGAESLVPSPKGTQLNTWTYWGDGSEMMLRPIKGNVEPFLRFIQATFKNNKTVTFSDNKVVPISSITPVEYLIMRMAWVFQQPTLRHPTWIYLIGPPLQGKSMLVNILARLIGLKYTSYIDETALLSSFSEWRAEKMFIVFDDVAVIKKFSIKELLKRMTTENSVRVNKKYQSEYNAKAYETFAFATNSLAPLLDQDDRRALVLEAKNGWTQDEWLEFDEWAARPASYNALLHYFMHEVQIDAKFLVMTPPKTQIREVVTESGSSSWDDFLNRLASPMGIEYPAPASGELRKFKPTIMTPEMLKSLYVVLNGPEAEKTQIHGGTLTAKLQRFGGVRLNPNDSDVSYPRITYAKVQTTLWTWESKWIDCSRDRAAQELNRLRLLYPELFSLFKYYEEDTPSMGPSTKY